MEKIRFIGVTFILKPGHELFNPASIIALLAGLSAAISLLLLRKVSQYDNAYTLMLYYFPLAFLFGALVSIFDWQTPDLHTIILLLGVGLFGTFYQECLIRASAYASARIVSSLLYLSIVFSGIFGWLIWNEIPGLLSWLGIILVCSGSILTVLYAKSS